MAHRLMVCEIKVYSTNGAMTYYGSPSDTSTQVLLDRTIQDVIFQRYGFEKVEVTIREESFGENLEWGRWLT